MCFSNWFFISLIIFKSNGVCDMLAEHRHLKCLTELIEFSQGILFECS